MIYRLNKSNYHDPDIIEAGRLAPRSYFIPFCDREQAAGASGGQMRYSSPKVKCLNGNWDFRFYSEPSALPDLLDTDKMEFDTIDVPSCWQFRGYDRPFYVNTRYQFPYAPPSIPCEGRVGKTFFWVGADRGAGLFFADPGDEYNHAGVYRTFFEADDDGRRYILSFLGVASCADVYVNGRFAGYTEGSHNTAEFDITDAVVKDRNELVVVVRRWCTGSYLECQDMFRNNGIFRDVLLRISEPTDVWDIDFSAVREGGGYRAVCRAEIAEVTAVRFSIEGHGLSVTKEAEAAAGSAEAEFVLPEVTEWNAEAPVLYDLYVETDTDCIRTRVGFRDIRIRGDIFTVNGRPLKLHGINHHDTDPVNGYSMTPAQLERDMRLCKEYNIDTVRTSHYPPDPYLLELCDELGLYVIDEADLETHGAFSMKLPPSYNRLSSDPAWEKHYLDRARCLYQRDKLHPSVIMWSLGNESGGYRNTDSMAEYIREHSRLPIHYESAVHCKRKAYDIASEMYPSPERIRSIGQKKCRVRQLCDRPYFMCEYAHAMGVGPGGMEKYWEEIYRYDSLMGGCVWEMADHAVLNSDGSYTYGGDHGEWEHDGSFCVDGIFYPDRSPSTGARITAFVYRPIRVSHLHGDSFEVFNTRAFTGGDSYTLAFVWNDGAREVLSLPVGPMQRMRVELDTASHIREARRAGTDCTVTVITTETVTGREVSREQLILEEYIKRRPADAGRLELPDLMRFDPVTRKEMLRIGRADLVPCEPATILFRAPVDNDFVLFGMRNIMKDYICESEHVISDERTPHRITVTSSIRCRRKEFICTDTYEACEGGKAILVTSRLRCRIGTGRLPRFGKAFRLGKDFTSVEYYGRNGESYADMKEQTQLEKVSCSISDMTEPNIRPQESGNRCDCRWASVSNGRQKITFEAVDRAFELGIKPYSDTELLGMKHREDEINTGTYVTLSAFQMGIGTGICGPSAADEFCYPAREEYVLSFIIRCEDID